MEEDAEREDQLAELVAGAGFEPAVRRLPDYEQVFFSPVIE